MARRRTHNAPGAWQPEWVDVRSRRRSTNAAWWLGVVTLVVFGITAVAFLAYAAYLIASAYASARALV